jgi:hypothetical protein
LDRLDHRQMDSLKEYESDLEPTPTGMKNEDAKMEDRLLSVGIQLQQVDSLTDDVSSCHFNQLSFLICGRTR